MWKAIKQRSMSAQLRALSIPPSRHGSQCSQNVTLFVNHASCAPGGGGGGVSVELWFGPSHLKAPGLNICHSLPPCVTLAMGVYLHSVSCSSSLTCSRIAVQWVLFVWQVSTQLLHCPTGLQCHYCGIWPDWNWKDIHYGGRQGWVCQGNHPALDWGRLYVHWEWERFQKQVPCPSLVSADLQRGLLQSSRRFFKFCLDESREQISTAESQIPFSRIKKSTLRFQTCFACLAPDLHVPTFLTRINRLWRSLELKLTMSSKRQVISDLLKPERQNLVIREDRKRGVYVEGLSEWVVRSPAEVRTSF